MVSISDFESGSLGSIPSESIFVLMRGIDACLQRLDSFITARQSGAALLLTHEEHNMLLEMTYHIVGDANSHLLLQELTDTLLAWFEHVVDIYQLTAVDKKRAGASSNELLYIEARARYALVVLFQHILQHSEELQCNTTNNDTEMSGFSKLLVFLHTPTEDNVRLYSDNIVVFLCDTLSWVCNCAASDTPDTAWIYSPESFSSITFTTSAMMVHAVSQSTDNEHTFTESYPIPFNSALCFRSVRGLYYLVLGTLSSLRHTDHVAQLCAISYSLMETLSPALLTDYAKDESNTMTFVSLPPADTVTRTKQSQKPALPHLLVLTKLVGFLTAVGNIYARILASYYFVYTELHVINTQVDDISMVEQLISDISTTLAITIARLVLAFIPDDNIANEQYTQNTPEETIDWLLSAAVSISKSKYKQSAITLDHDIQRYDAYFYVMTALILPIRYVCNYFYRTFGIHTCSFDALLSSNKVIYSIPALLLSHFTLKQSSIGLIRGEKLKFYQIFLSGYGLSTMEYESALLPEPAHSYTGIDLIEPFENIPHLRLMQFLYASPYAAEPYAHNLVTQNRRENLHIITTAYLAESLGTSGSVLIVGDFLAQTLGAYSTSIYLEQFLRAAKKIDIGKGTVLTTLKAWIAIFRAFKLASEYYASTYALVTKDVSIPLCIYESFTLYNDLFPSILFLKLSTNEFTQTAKTALTSILMELLYLLGLTPLMTTAVSVGVPKQTTALTRSLVQEIYILVSAASEEDKWACSALVDGLLYNIATFTSVYTKSCYIDHCLLLDLILKHIPTNQQTAALNRFAILTLGPLAVADLASVIITESRTCTSFILRHVVPLENSVITLCSRPEYKAMRIDAAILSANSQSRHFLTQNSELVDVPSDLLDVAYDTLISEILCNEAATRSIFNSCCTVQHLMNLPVFQAYPMETIISLVRDIHETSCEDKDSVGSIQGSTTKCVIRTTSPFTFDPQSAKHISILSPLLLSFSNYSLTGNYLQNSLKGLKSLNMFPGQTSAINGLATLGELSCSPLSVLSAIFTIAALSAYLYNWVPSLDSACSTPLLDYLSWVTNSVPSGYAGAYYCSDLRHLTRSADNSTGLVMHLNASVVPDERLKAAINITMYYSDFIDRFLTLRATLLIAGEKLTKQGGALLTDIEVIMSLVASIGDVDGDAEVCSGARLLNLQSGNDLDSDMLQLAVMSWHIIRKDFYRLVNAEKLCVRQSASLQHMDHSHAPFSHSDVVAKEQDQECQSSYSLEGILTAFNATFDTIPLADEKCGQILLCSIVGENPGSHIFMFRTLGELYLGAFSIYAVLQVRLQCTLYAQAQTPPRRDVLLRIIYLFCNFCNMCLYSSIKVSYLWPASTKSETSFNTNDFIAATASDDKQSNISIAALEENRLAAATLNLLMYTLERAICTIGSCAHNPLDWILIASSPFAALKEPTDFFTLLFYALYGFLQQSSCAVKTSIPTACPSTSTLHLASLRVQSQLYIVKCLKAMLKSLTKHISGVDFGEALPSYSLLHLLIPANEPNLHYTVASLCKTSHRQITPAFQKFSTEDILYLHTLHPFEPATLEDILRLPPFQLSNCNLSALGSFLCHPNCGCQLLAILLRVLLSRDSVYVDFPIVLLYTSRLSWDHEVVILANACLKRHTGTESLFSIDISTLVRYVKEGYAILSSFLKCESTKLDRRFYLWMRDAFSTTIITLIQNMNLHTGSACPNGSAAVLCEMLLQYLKPDAWKEQLLDALNALSDNNSTPNALHLSIEDQMQTPVDAEQSIGSLFEKLSLNALKILAKDSGNVKILLSRSMQEHLPVGMHVSIIFLVLLSNPLGYLKYILSIWMSDTRWAAILLTCLGAPIFEYQRSLPLELVFRSLFDFDAMFRLWMDSATMEHILRYYSAQEQPGEQDLSIIPEALVANIFAYQSSKCIFGTVSIVAIMLALYLIDEIPIEVECAGTSINFQGAVMNIFLAAADFFHLEEVRHTTAVFEFSSLFGYFYHNSADAISLVAAISVSAAPNSFVRTPNLSGQELLYNVQVTSRDRYSIKATNKPSLLHILTNNERIVPKQKRMKHNIMGKQATQAFVNVFILVLSRIYHSFEAEHVPSIESTIPSFVSFYHDLLSSTVTSSRRTVIISRVLQGVVTGVLSISSTAASIPIETVDTLIKTLAITAQNYYSLSGIPGLFSPIIRILASIFHRWDATGLQHLNTIVSKLYAIPCICPIHDLTVDIGLLLSQLLNLFPKTGSKPSCFHRALAAAGLLSIGDTDLAASVLQLCDMNVPADTACIRKKILECVAASPIEPAIKQLLPTVGYAEHINAD